MNEYIDRALRDDNWILKNVQNENANQLMKWGVQVRTAFEWLAYLTEELGEMAEAISEYEYREGTKEQVVHEAIQVATLALKVAEMFEAEI